MVDTQSALTDSQLQKFILDLIRQGKRLSTDSRKVKQEDVFLSIPPLKGDGTPFILDALEKGARQVIIEKSMREVLNKTKASPLNVVEVPNARSFYAKYADAFYPQQPSFIAGVTGTNGKSSVAAFARQVWNSLGYKSASVGTLGIQVQGVQESLSFPSSTLTSPDALDLHQSLQILALAGVSRACLEVSSHGLDQRRLDEVRFRAAIFTNFNHEHLDYHGSIENYFGAKKRFFSDLLPVTGYAILNADIPSSGILKEVCEGRGVRTFWFGRHGKEVVQEEVTVSENGFVATFVILGKRYEVPIPLFGSFQVENVMAVIALMLCCDEPVDQVLDAVSKLQHVPGRMDLVGYHPKVHAPVFVDYAHKPMALKYALQAIRAHTPGRMIVVFGCGGDRDKEKRPMMGEIADQLADLVYVTDDNPRTEDPASIRKQILKGCSQAFEIPDRREAIMHAIKNLRKGDACIIAGKGHESGQIVGHEILHFNDSEVVLEVLAALKKKSGRSKT